MIFVSLIDVIVVLTWCRHDNIYINFSTGKLYTNQTVMLVCIANVDSYIPARHASNTPSLNSSAGSFMPTGVAWLVPGIESVMLLLIHEAMLRIAHTLTTLRGW